jgi:hypothetical protein
MRAKEGVLQSRGAREGRAEDAPDAKRAKEEASQSQAAGAAAVPADTEEENPETQSRLVPVIELLSEAEGLLDDTAEAFRRAMEACDVTESGEGRLPVLPADTLERTRKMLDWLCDVYLPMQRRAAWVAAGNLCHHCGKAIPAKRLRTRCLYCCEEHQLLDRVRRYRLRRGLKKVPLPF